MQFKGCEVVEGDSAISEDCSDDVAGNGSCGVTVSVMIYSADDTLLKIIDVAHDAKYGNRQGFFSNPTFAKFTDSFRVEYIGFSKVKRIFNLRLEILQVFVILIVNTAFIL